MMAAIHIRCLRVSARTQNCLFALGFFFALAGSTAWAQPRGLGHRPPTPEEQAYLEAHVVEVTEVAPSALSVARAFTEALSGGGSLNALETTPSAVDNSTLTYFPPIRSQGSQGSCTCWASCYYYSTYTQARDEGYTVSGGDNTKISSPAFMYPLVNDGVDEGANTGYTLARLNDIGCSSWTKMPYSQSDWTTWPTEAAWIEALGWRTSTAHSINGRTTSGLNSIKQYVANGNVVVTDFTVYDNFYDTYPSATTGINNRVYYAQSGSLVGGHAVTIVGYDDNRSYVDHRDGLTHYGAFLMANSWGSSWGWYNSTGTGSKGFFWVAYAMFTEQTFGPTVYYNDDRPQYRPTIYAVAGLNHSQRGRITYSGGIGSTGSPQFTSPTVLNRDGGNSLAITDAKRVAVDLTDGAGYILPNVAKQVFVKLSVTAAASSSGTITSADFIHDLDGNGIFQTVSSSSPPVTVTHGKTGYATANVIYDPNYTISITTIERPASNLNWVKITWSGASPTVATIYWTNDLPNDPARTWNAVDGAALSNIVDNGNGTFSWTDKGTDPDMGGQAPGAVRQRFYRLVAQ
jgi:C1A family cysteine protease